MARLLVVENEAQVLMLAEAILQQAGHDTLSAGTVAEVQAIINDPAQNSTWLFTDIELGNHKEGGITLGKLVGETRKGTPVLYTSGRELTDGMRALFVEPSALRPKVYTAQELTEAVAALMKCSVTT